MDAPEPQMGFTVFRPQCQRSLITDDGSVCPTLCFVVEGCREVHARVFGELREGDRQTPFDLARIEPDVLAELGALEMKKTRRRMLTQGQLDLVECTRGFTCVDFGAYGAQGR
jgi:hypothetical protein